jgi:predicted acylesterase/phospholipase RssA
MHPRAAGRRRARRLPGRRLRGTRRGARGADLVAGISIGAINAALIAGNPPERRVARLRGDSGTASRRFRSASRSRRFRRRRVDRPGDLLRQRDDRDAVRRRRLLPAARPAAPFSRRERSRVSYYDTEPLRRNTQEMVDFDLINFGGAAFVGAVSVKAAASSTSTAASGARRSPRDGERMPPGFPPVEIDGEFTWDGGGLGYAAPARARPARGNQLVFRSTSLRRAAAAGTIADVAAGASAARPDAPQRRSS